MTVRKDTPWTLVDGFKVYEPVPNDAILGNMSLPILRAYARHYGIVLHHNPDEIRTALKLRRDDGVVYWEDSAEPVRPAEPPQPQAPKGNLGPAPVARAGEVIRAKPSPNVGINDSGRMVTEPPKPTLPVVSPQKTAPGAAPRVEPITVALWQQGAGQVSDLLHVRWTQENAYRICKDFRLGDFKNLPHFLTCLHEAARLHGLMGATRPEPAPDEEEGERAPAPPPQVCASPNVQGARPKAPNRSGTTPEERAACERTGLGVVHYRLLTCLADGEPRSYREIEKSTGYYSILTAELRKGKAGSLGDRGFVEEELRDEDPSKRPVLTFRITPAGLDVLRR